MVNELRTMNSTFFILSLTFLFYTLFFITWYFNVILMIIYMQILISIYLIRKYDLITKKIEKGEKQKC